MPISYPPRPTFLLRRTLEWLGGASPLDFVVPTGTGLEDAVRTNAAVKEWWSALEPLILVLALAGYECPEIVVVKAGQARGYLRLPVWEGLDIEGLIAHKNVNWAPATGVTAQQLGGTAWAATLLRVTARRTIDTPVRRAENRPPRFTPLPLTGPLPAIGATTGSWPRYAPHTEPGDDFADPADGWIVFTHPAGPTDAMRIPKQLAAAAVAPRDAVLDALVAAPPGAGIVAALDPATWTSALDRSSWVWPFDTLVARIWAATGPAGLRTKLRLPIEDKAVSFKAMAEAVAPALDAELGGDSRTAAIAALRERTSPLGLDDASVATLLTSLEGAAKHRHWILTLFALHEVGLIRLLPFGVDYEPGIAYSDLTGWYEAGYDNFNQPDNTCVQLNQAGNRLIGWLQDGVLNRYDIDAELVSYDPAGGAPLAYAVSGAGPGDVSTIDLIPREDPTELGLRVVIERTSGSSLHALVRRHRCALVPPPAVAAALGTAAPADFVTQVLPLHSRVQLAIENAKRAITTSVASMMQSVDRTSWDMELGTLANRLKEILGDAGVIQFDLQYDANNQPVTTVQPSKTVERFRLLIQQELRRSVIVADDTADALTRLREVVTWVESEQDGLPDVTLVSTIVGIAPHSHKYTIAMAEIGPTGEAELIAGGWAGIAAIPTSITHSATCRPPGAPQPHDWWEIYAGVMGQAGVGLSSDFRARVEVLTLSTGNDLTAALDWGPDDFVGSWFLLGETNWEVSVYPGWGVRFGPGLAGGQEYETYTFFSRSKGWATGQGDGVFVSFGVAAAVAAGGFTGLVVGPFGAGANPAGGKIGVLFARLGLANPPTAPPPPPPPAPLPLTMTVERTPGFAFDSSELSDEAKDELARIVARHRQLLECPNAHVEIEGDASPPGTDPYNDLLSWKRALAVYSHVVSLLSVPASIDDWWPAANAFAVRDCRVELLGNGEIKARYSTQHLPNQDWQRCKLTICGQVMVLL